MPDIKEAMEALYSCLVLVRTHQQCTSTASKLGREPGTSEIESKASASTLPDSLILIYDGILLKSVVIETKTA